MNVTSRYRAVPDAESRSRCDRLLAWLRDYAARRVNSRLIDERRCIPPYVVLDLGNQGVFGVQVEEAYGGLGLRNRDVARVLEQAAALDMALGTFVLVCLFPGIRPISAFASTAFKQEVLPRLATGRILAGYAQTEPGAGTHFPAMSAQAESTGPGSWRLSGEKIWIGNATWAGYLSVMAHDVEGGRRKGMTAFAVPTDRAGVYPGRELLSLGMRGMVQSEVSFRDVEVGEADVLGARGRGLEVGVDSMSFSRFAIAATCIGGMKRAAQGMLRFGMRRSIATGRLLDHPLTLTGIGETAARIAAVEGLVGRVADALDAGRGVPAELFAVCKIAGSEFLWETADRLVQTLGSRGYDEENLAPQLLRDARVTRIFEGTSEALVAFVGAAVLNPESEVHAFLRGELSAGPLADGLTEAVERLRGRDFGAAGGEPPRTWQCALAGRAATWALVAGVLQADSAATPEGERLAAWARRRFDDALEHARGGAPEELALLDPAEAEKTVTAYEDAIGDPEQTLPGERLGLDPLLRRAPTESDPA